MVPTRAAGLSVLSPLGPGDFALIFLPALCVHRGLPLGVFPDGALPDVPNNVGAVAVQHGDTENDLNKHNNVLVRYAYITIKVNRSFVQVKESVQLTWF